MIIIINWVRTKRARSEELGESLCLNHYTTDSTFMSLPRGGLPQNVIDESVKGVRGVVY